MARECFECGMPAVCSHHVVPKSRGGVCTVGLCALCHAKAHHVRGNMYASVLTKQALDARRKARKVCGQIPFGYFADPFGILHKEPAEQEVIQKIIACRKVGLSYRAIAKAMTVGRTRTKSGLKPWSHSSIVSIIEAEVRRWRESIYDNTQGGTDNGEST